MYEDTPKPLRNLARSEPLTERSRRMFNVPTEILETEVNLLPSACRDFLTKPVAPATKPLYALSGENYVLKGRVSDLTAKQKNGILNCLNVPNGIKMVSVTIDDTNNLAELDVHFFNINFLDKIVAKYDFDNTSAKAVFPISGGSRLRAGQAAGQVQVDSSNKPTLLAIQMPNEDKPMLRLVVKPIGDYSTYTLAVSPMAIGLPSAEAPAEIPSPVMDSLPAACIDFLTKPAAKSSPQALYTLSKQKKAYVLGVPEIELSAEQRTGILRCLNAVFDPLFAEINFKFRPGCFNTNCAPEWEIAPPPMVEPPIDYLAKDYESFRLTMIAAMMERVPGWQATSEADLDVTLLELFSAAADELSDFQDRVMNEAFIASCRKRVSLARHSRLMDYHIHQGNQASTRLALEVEHEAPEDENSPKLKEGFLVWSGESEFDADNEKHPADSAAVFTLGRGESQTVHQLLNRIGLYTWSDSIPALKAGSTTADLKLYNKLDFEDASATEPAADKDSAETVQKLIRNGEIKYLLIQERLNPTTGFAAGRDPSKRQFLRLLSGDKGATAMFDAVENEWFVRVKWEKTDALRRDYCFTVDCPADSPGTAVGKAENITLFHGNLVEIFHGRPQTTVFRESGKQLTIDPAKPLELFYERTRWGAICPLPEKFLAYQKTDAGGDIPPVSTLIVKVGDAGGTDFWDEVPSLIYSDNSDENGDHFIVETDEEHRSLIRFGNGKNGKELPENAKVFCYYQYGEPLTGNVGADSIINFDAGSIIAEPESLTISSCWNPLDVTDGKDFEPVIEIIRRVPEAYRARQLRAVTLADYVARAEDKEIGGVARAAASYAWTGSWRTVRVTIDPIGTNEISDELRRKVSAYLDAVRLIGEDIEIRPPKFVPLEIEVSLCAEPEIWAEDIRFVLEQEFSDGWTPDGRMGFFHPDLWTFGQTLYASQIIGRAMQVKGVEHIISISMKRWNSPSAASASITNVNYNEIIEVLSDPDHFERGFIRFEIKGGRQ
jgi:hypothetical protein